MTMSKEEIRTILAHEKEVRAYIRAMRTGRRNRVRLGRPFDESVVQETIEELGIKEKNPGRLEEILNQAKADQHRSERNNTSRRRANRRAADARKNLPVKLEAQERENARKNLPA